MTAERIALLEADLIAWGLVERNSEGLSLTRRLRAAVARAAERLQEREKRGEASRGDPLEEAVREALAEFPLPSGARLDRGHLTFLVAVELASLPDEVRVLLGRR